MSNPFSRTRSAPESAFPVLAGLGMLSYQDMKDGTESCRAQCLIAAAGSKRGELVTKCLQEESPPIPVLMDALVAATEAGDETNQTMALDMTGRILPLSQRDNSPISLWPQPLIWAATWLNMARLADTLLSNGADPDPQTGPKALTTGFFPCPLYMTSRLGYASTVRVLLAHNARTDVLRKNRFGCFYVAAHQGHVDVMQEYLAKDHSHLKSRQPMSVLSVAAALGNWKTVAALVDLGMDPNRPEVDPDDDNREWTPLAVACNWGYPKTTKVLLENGADPNSLGPYEVDTPLWFAAVLRPSVQCVRYLLQHGGDPNHERLQPPLMLELVGARHDVDTIISICDVLIASDPPIQLGNPDKFDGETALMQASRIGQLPLVQWLLEHGADVNVLDNDKRGALHFAVSSGNTVVVQELLKRKPELNIVNDRDSETLLHTALHKPAIVKLLLDAGADPELANSSGSTLINSAVVQCKPDVVKMLIERKVNVHHPDRHGWTPICDAVAYVREASLVRLLADEGANLCDTINGSSLLHAALDGSPEILRILLQFGKFIDLNHRDSRNETPLLAVRSRSNLDCVKLLIQAGADVNAQDNGEETPLHNAMWYDMPDYLTLLSQPDIDVNRISARSGGPFSSGEKGGLSS